MPDDAKTSREAYCDMSKESKERLDALLDGLEQKIRARNEARDRRQNSVPIDHEDRRTHDRRRAPRGQED